MRGEAYSQLKMPSLLSRDDDEMCWIYSSTKVTVSATLARVVR
jgi:hypothetical protein